MRDKKLLNGVYNVYAVYDKISKHYRQILYASNDEDFVRLYLPSIILEVPLRELAVYRIAIFNDVTGELKSCIRKTVNLDCYKFPHSRLSPVGEDISKEEIEKELIKTKNEILAKSKTVEEKEVVNE